MDEVLDPFPDLGSGTVVVHIEQAFEPLVPRFLENRRREIVTMREALAQGEYDLIRRVAHGIKGAGGSYGLDDLSVVGAHLEAAAKREDAAYVGQGLEALASYMDRLEIVYE